MNKCEHGQKLSLFCASQNCQYKQITGCDLCIKKYHNHLHTTIHLNQQQVQNLIKKFTLDNTIKPKCRLLQQSIYNYFNQIKNQIINILQVTNKNIINQIGYPYLFTTNTLSTYKRLKNKEYKKIPPKQFRVYYQIAHKIQQKELFKEQNRIYLSEIKNFTDILNQLESTIKNIQNITKNYNNTPAHQLHNYQKICQIIRSIQTQSPAKSFKKNNQSKQKDAAEIKYNREVPKINIINSPITQFTPINPKIEIKNFDTRLAQIKNRGQKSQSQQSPLLGPSGLQPSKTLKVRDISLDKKIIKQQKFNGNEIINNQQQKIRQNNKIDSGLPHQKIQSLRQELNYKEMQINQKKKLLMGIIKPNDKNNDKPFQKLQSIELSPIKPRLAEFLRKEQSSQTRSVNQSKSSRSSQDLAIFEEVNKIQQNTKNYAFTKLPIVQDMPKKQEQKPQIKKKLIIIPTQINNKNSGNKLNQIDSPLYKKKRIENNQQSKYKDHSKQKYDTFASKRNQDIKGINKQILEIKENQQKSLALLLKSLTLSAQSAIPLLQSSLKYADNNLSAAQYLSYLYLQLNRPRDCLKLCNKFIDKIQSSTQSDLMSINLNNNRAAALNIIGRYSQAIFILQRCLTFKQKDTLYKNLGDSYFSIGIYEKAILNYEKSIKLNNNNDETHYNLAVCLYLIQNYQNSKLQIKKALQINNKNQQYQQLQNAIDNKLKSL